MTPSPRPRPSSLPPVQYKGEDLDAARGPGLGCFWVQVIVLGALVVLTPIGVNLGWPDWLNALLLFATIGLLLVTGQTIIFLLRIVAAERRSGRRRPMAVARSSTVGELEDAASGVGELEDAASVGQAEVGSGAPPADAPADPDTAGGPTASSRSGGPTSDDLPRGERVRE